MTNTRRIILSLLAGLTVTAVMWAAPLAVTSTNAHLSLAAAQAQQKLQMMSGKISSIQPAGHGSLQDSFTIDVTEEKTEVFFMVPQTKITPKEDFKVGNMAEVSYGFDREHNKIAAIVEIKK